MRRNQKDFFSSAEPESGSRTTKDILKKSLPFGQPLSYKSHKSYKSRKCALRTPRCLAWIFAPLLRTLIRSRMFNPLPHHRLAKTQISCAILPRPAANKRQRS